MMAYQANVKLVTVYDKVGQFHQKKMGLEYFLQKQKENTKFQLELKQLGWENYKRFHDNQDEYFFLNVMNSERKIMKKYYNSFILQ